jgi:hypothetical protein
MNDLQRRRAEIVAEINALELEARAIDQQITEANNTIDDGSLPCLQCAAPQAKWIKHWVAQGASAQIHRTASGLPVTCCQITVAKSRSTVAASL